MSENAQQLKGLGGWLILLAFGLIALPSRLFMHSQEMGRLFSMPEIQAYTQSDPTWHALAVLETFGHAVAILPVVMLILLFFFKHRSFPIAFSIVACFLMLLAIARLYFVISIPTISQTYRRDVLAPTLMSLLVFAVWIAYVFRSQRVRFTFTRRFYLTPAFPFVSTV